MMKDLEQKKKEAEKTIASAVDSDVPKIYFNGVINSLSNTDALIVLQRNQKPVAVLNASFSTLKTLVKLLADLVQQLEDMTGQEIMTADFIEQKVTQRARKSSASEQ